MSLGQAAPKEPALCPECGGPALVNTKNGKWWCVATDNVSETVKVLVCAAKGRRVNGDLLIAQCSNGIWQKLLNEDSHFSS